MPGSKSLTNRYLALAALADSPTTIHYPLIARDTLLMAEAIEALGASVDISANTITVTPAPLHGGHVDAGLAGTVMRFIPALAMLAEGTTHLTGDVGAAARPMGPMVAALETLGITVQAAQNPAGEACLPLTIEGTPGLPGGTVELDASASSQFLSALMLAAPACAEGLDIRHTGERLPSAPHLAMTVATLKNAGVQVDAYDAHGRAVDGTQANARAVRWRVYPGPIHLGTITVEPDLSNAGPFLAAAMVAGGSVAIEGWPEETTQAGAHFVQIFQAMGARVAMRQGALELEGPPAISGIDLDMHDVGELVPTVAAVAAFASSPSTLRNIGQLRGHETDRLAALEAELRRVGCGATASADSLHIEPAQLHSAPMRTYHDHRMATFAAILGLTTQGVTIENVETTAKTFPQFTQMWADLAGGAALVEPCSVDIATAKAHT